eukprot:TRINITY_DN2910_c1_g1_i5.p1 TRINITY_DN2910_c1_g1~~TRINITY_DN2910_c1_g1_i5.p1  ORF type:complete len:104 (+),score=15.53 TRINITY_DN2910_c1_g1_i5:2-313(+)
MERAMEARPEGQDNILAIFDMRAYGPGNTDLQFIKFLIDLLFIYYPKRVGRVLVVESPWVFRPVWEVVKPLLFKYAQLVQFCSLRDVWERFDSMDEVPVQLRK